MRYYQNEETSRVLASDSALNKKWHEITKEQYVAGEKATTDRIVLKREGFQDLTIRNRNNTWQLLEYTDHYGWERWVKIDETKYDIEAHIDKYSLPK